MPWDGVSHLCVMDLATGQSRAVWEANDRIEAPNWTRDDRLIFNSRGRLYVHDLRTGRTDLIDTGFAGRVNNDHVVSPCGRYLAISHAAEEDGLSRVYVLPVQGGAPRLVTPLGPSYLHGWSPDGATLAYCASRGGEYDVYAMPVQGGAETRLTDAPGLNDGPEYAPGGDFIWFNSVRTGLMQIFRMRPDGSEQTQMTFDQRNNWFPHLSPDGRWVLYIAYQEGDVEPGAHPPDRWVELRIMPSEGGASRQVAKLFGGQGSHNVNSWAQDSRRFAYVSYGHTED